MNEHERRKMRHHVATMVRTELHAAVEATKLAKHAANVARMANDLAAARLRPTLNATDATSLLALEACADCTRAANDLAGLEAWLLAAAGAVASHRRAAEAGAINAQAAADISTFAPDPQPVETDAETTAETTAETSPETAPA